MTTTNRTEAADIVSTRKTFDGVTVYLHADGPVSDRLSYFRGKLPVATMWRVWGDICTYTHAEIPGMIRSVKSGAFVPVRIRQTPTREVVEARFAKQVRTMGFNAAGWLVKY